MNRRSWIVALAVVAVALVAFGGPSLIAQDAGKKAAAAQDKDSAKAAKAAKEAAFKKLFPAAKVSLVAGLKTVEDANKGAHAHSVEYEMSKDGKSVEIEVGLLVGDKLTKVYVDSDTGKIKEPAAPAAKKAEKGEKDEDGEEDDDD
jgi:hypothetical protein